MNQPTDPAPTSPRQPVSAEQLEQKILELTKDRDDWKHEWEIYKGAWLRELGGYFRNKHHLIDALVVSTRELRERANTVALERDELFAKNKKLLEAYRSASLPVTPEPLHDLLDEVYGAFHPFLSVTGEMSSEDQWPKEHMVEFTICWEHILRAFHAWENLGDYLSEAASLPVQQAQPRSREFTYAVRLANKVLERPSGDPDDDLAVLSRQFLRAIESKPTAAPSTPPASSPLPAYLQNDEEFGRCSACGRKTWTRAEMGTQCKMTQPDGTKCAGIFRASSHNTTEGK